MQKMTNIFLANKENTSANLSVGGIKQGDKSRTQSSENNDFSVALEQASIQAQESNRAESVNVETRSAQDDPTLAGSGDESEREARVADKDIDVNHVLAQINWASKLDGNTRLDNSGDTLPQQGNEQTTSDARLDDDLLSVVNDADNTEFNLAAEELIAGNVAMEPSQPASRIYVETLAIDADAEIIDADAEIIDADAEVIDADIQLSHPEAQLLDPNTQLPLDKNLIDKLVQASGLSEAELTQYPPENLIQLIVTVTSSEFQAASVRSPASVGSREGSESRSAGLTQANNTLPLPEAETSDKSSAVKDVAKVTQSQQAAGLDVLTRTENKIEQGKDKQFSSILGEKTQLEPSSKLTVAATVKAEQQLKGAELSVQLNPLKANIGASATLMDTTSTSNLEINTLAGMQIGSTPQSKTDTPQFQLLSRQNNDTQSQMQEMIQRFSPVMKQQLVTMVSQGTLHAEIRLDPPELGPLVVRIQIQGDQTQVQFHVVQPQTRDIIEQALPKLREMLAEQGLQLTDSQVSQRDSGKDQGEAEHSERSQEGYDAELDEISADESLLSLNQPSSYRSAIDYYA
ncbi:putative Flagellar hook-length control protein FliK [Shewanella benthica]|uniref:Putative Flagellar hook-length control protein FliK n=1 Tax=Shewanella benthica TaxID=43661 RepID=A0A330M5I7_9GAMM|nr:flagellar hook-length control protein FliK [Shewanella benthica]SQH77541.1 putative Flagellar hook-length control protein FliK [Shewanella benthica]